MTVAPTMIEASQKRNVIPALCEVTVDCRLLPGQTQARGRSEVRAARRGGLRVRLARGAGGTRSPMDARSGTRSSRGRRGRAGRRSRADLPRRASRTATGCARRSARSPTASSRCATWSELATRLVHSADERIGVDDLELGRVPPPRCAVDGMSRRLLALLLPAMLVGGCDAPVDDEAAGRLSSSTSEPSPRAFRHELDLAREGGRLGPDATDRGTRTGRVSRRAHGRLHPLTLGRGVGTRPSRLSGCAVGWIRCPCGR